MNVISTKGWKDYELLDSGNSKRYERFGEKKLVRPDPQAIWLPNSINWENDSEFAEDKGWNKNITDWSIQWKNLKFKLKQTKFKHTGIFPEQVLNWEFIEQRIRSAEGQPNVLNLFGYTGASSLVCAANNAKITHVDGSKPSISWARENQALSNLSDKPIRWILDDVLDFTAREARRGNVYDALIMDPPVYGHGPDGQIWDFNKSFPQLLQNVKKIIRPKPLFLIINAYAISSSSVMLRNTIEDYLSLNPAKIEYGELGLEEKSRNRLLSTGIFARYSSK